MTTWQVIVEEDDGQFVTYVPALDFASTHGPTRDIALERTQEMIAGYLEAGTSRQSSHASSSATQLIAPCGRYASGLRRNEICC
jgi:predicted RNase H-like HicB family nuclease